MHKTREYVDPFKGMNEMFEIETMDELKNLLAKHGTNVSMKDWVFQAVDLSSIPLNDFQNFDVRGAQFWGCTFPEGSHFHSVKSSLK